MTAAFVAGCGLGWSRLVARRALVFVGLAVATSSLVALSLRASSPLGAPDALLAAAFGLMVPVAALASVATVTDRRSLEDAVWPAARHGLSRRGVALGLLAVAFASAFCAMTPALGLGLVLAYGRTPGLGRDLATAGWLACLAALAYTALVGLGATTMRRGRGRGFVLLLDLLLGSSSSVLALPFPRAHLESLLGGAPVAALSQPASSVALGLVAAIALLVTLARTPE